jgi:hypothetical protein
MRWLRMWLPAWTGSIAEILQGTLYVAYVEIKEKFCRKFRFFEKYFFCYEFFKKTCRGNICRATALDQIFFVC